MNLKDNTPKAANGKPLRGGIAGQVRAIREVADGVQAEVCVGASPMSYQWLKGTSNTPAVQAALAALRVALVDAADADLKAAQDDTEARGGRPVGRR